MATERNAEQTRTRILEAAHEEIYQNGYQGMRIEAILQKTNLAKGALYHHFPNKLALGYAVVDEILMEHFHNNWNEFRQQYPDPLTAMQQLFLWKAEKYRDEQCFKGCPLNNLNQEMAAIDAGFHARLEMVMEAIYQAIVQALELGQQQGDVRADINPTRIAMFIMASYQGIMGAAKCMQAPELLSDLFSTLNDYIDTLRTPDQPH
ncbi:putative transcriptional regulator [Cellvibrio sp. BR]|jgi:TetR/AcrR family transcriptional repressor of nem operon|uniref:TetR/AcrR family transcriptional regulator n=1 Tax=unclassified Cellvibrio TaxID=2624793 RepID=UPI0002600D5A|nr:MULTISPECIES: TetR/AcrR family transcriptional regulator [unclassified Cellvibrio]EIK44321.1 putative transcriptional regulator [Cellvibrio sp. BR]QEY12274.1 TetR/AcrR family transcriptional regulator [Cellvibrio sp. KY-YJ-3]UUA72503.1 TetR/AcrR family transcriptional regulator [Cellvibrio sp. QJXJ]